MVYTIYILYIIVAPLPGLLLFVINFIIRGCNPNLDFFEKCLKRRLSRKRSFVPSVR